MLIVTFIAVGDENLLRRKKDLENLSTKPYTRRFRGHLLSNDILLAQKIDVGEVV